MAWLAQAGKVRRTRGKLHSHRIGQDRDRAPDWFMPLESRLLLSAAFDVTGITALRQDASFFGSNGQTQIDGSGVTVAILDTGGYASNPDLQGNFLGFYDAVTQPESATLVTDPSQAFDNAGHGTHTTGIAASSNSNIGVAYAAKFIDIRVLADSFTEAQLAGDPLLRGLNWVYAHAQQYNIRVVNMSLGDMSNYNAFPGTSDEYRAIQQLESIGVTVVSAAGNDYADYVSPGQADPAVYSTISVANTWATDGEGHDFNFYMYGGDSSRYAAYETDAAVDEFSATSQRSSMSNQVAAPGVDIYSTWNNSTTDGASGDLLHNTLSGTSMAAPLVSGIVALMQDAAQTYGGRYLQPSEVLSILRDTAITITDSNVTTNGRIPIQNGEPVGSEQDLPETGLQYKRVDAHAAIQRVLQLLTGNYVPTPTPTPSQGNDANNLSVTATVVPTLNGTATFSFSGNVGSDGALGVGENDVDLFKVELQSPGYLTITLSPVSGGQAFSAALRVFNSNLVEIGATTGTAGNYPGLETNQRAPLATGTYYIGVSSSGNTAYNPTNGQNATGGSSTGDYVLTLALNNPDPNGTAQGATDVNLTLPNYFLAGTTTTPAVAYAGLLGSDPPPLNASERIQVPDGDVDMYRVVAPDTGVLTIDTEARSAYGAAGADTYLRVFDASLQEIAYNDDKSQTNRDSILTLNVTAGQTYYVAVTNYANRNFSVSDPYAGRVASSTMDESYDVYFSFSNGDINGTVFSATAATVGQALNDAIGADNGAPLQGASAGAKDVDFYRFTMATSGLFDFQVVPSSGNAAPVVTFWSASTNPNAVQGNAFSSQIYTRLGDSTASNGHLVLSVTAGQVVYVSISGVGNNGFNWAAVASGSAGQTGTYVATSVLRASSELSGMVDNAIGGALTTITLDQGITGVLGQDDAVIVGRTDIDLYKFIATTSMVIDFRTNTSMEGSVDTVLRLFDASGNELAFNDNADATSSASKVAYLVTAGMTYYIGISGAGAGARSYNPVTGGSAVAGATGLYGVILTGGTSDERFVGQAYADLLGRGVDAGGLAYWSQQLMAGMSRPELAAQLTASDEYISARINEVYEQMLGRASDAGGLTYFAGALRNGLTLREMKAMVAGSAEYWNRHGQSAQGFAQGLFADMLGREADALGTAYVVGTLTAGGSRTEVAGLISGSQEYLQDLVNNYFAQFLRRGVDAVGQAYFVTQLQEGATESQVIGSLVGSSEYYVGGVELSGSPTERYVVQLYEDLLGRMPDEMGLEVWTVRLDLGRNREAVAQQLLASTEYRTLWVNGAYGTILGRSADTTGITAMVAALGSGASNEQIEAQLLGSTEFYGRMGSTTEGFIVGLYGVVLDRAPDGTGTAYVANQLAIGTPRTTVSLVILSSSEYRTALIEQFYQTYLGRSASDAELQPALTALNQGTLQQDVLAGILGSDEFYARIQ